DFSPAKKPLLFGHHFSSIAGAGPIVGPLIAVLYFGWAAATLWVALGSVFMGAVHDYVSLMVSVRNGGRSVGDIAQQALGNRSRVLFSCFVWLTLVLVVAVFAVVTSKTFVQEPEIVIPTFGLIFVAMGFGYLVYRRGFSIFIGTLLALVALELLLSLGMAYPVNISSPVFGLEPATFWFWILIVYALFASVLPVWFLLQPRDYLSVWILLIGLALGYLGLIFSHPRMTAPAFVGFSSAHGTLWPMLFVIIACGAISGFHSLVASGTSSKQLANESAGRAIGFGGMIMEAALALLVILIAGSSLVWEPSGKVSTFGYQYLMGEGGGPIVAFSKGFGRMVDALPGMTLVAGMYISMLMLNAFVITSLDTATRLARFIVNELGGEKVPFLRNRWIGALLTVGAAGYLGASGGYQAIWPLFGAANQLVAALTLIVLSAYLVGVKRPRIYTTIPAIFMLITTIGALVYSAVSYFQESKFVLGGIAVILIILAIVIAHEAGWFIGGKFRKTSIQMKSLREET
ncbi:carbon starvation protein A, partial [bacterium]|nr:carbon starvation protein A [bacterium]